ncbi:MAG: hypothetical protein RIR76_999 [Verrucomicrobiota bacterium]|jgi:N-acetylmuramoyl-L-alanine amidase|nr:N-acetylmuramoyl-L-alanine amidase [Opitutaceae bacterium]
MIRAAFLLFLAIVPAFPAGAAENSVRSAPTRPGAASPAVPSASAPAAPSGEKPLPGKRFGRIEYVSLAAAAPRLGARLNWLEAGRRLELKGPGGRAEVETDSREITVNGLRVFLGDPVVASGGDAFVSRVDHERCLLPLLRPGHGQAPRAAPRVIVLDPGHGGTDPGKINDRLGISEKTLTLDVARRAQRLLEADGHRVLLTRDDDSFVALPQRAAAARAAKADVFVSIHFNAVPRDNRTSGVEVYTFAPRFQRSTNAWGAGARDDTEEFASPANRHDHWNVLLAHALHRRFVNDLKSDDRGKKLMHLAVLRPLDCPGVLVECGFLSSDAEARKIASPAHRQQLAVAIAAGLRDYAAVLARARAK